MPTQLLIRFNSAAASQRSAHAVETGVEASFRSARAGERSAEAAIRSARAGEKSAQAGVRSAEAAIRSARAGEKSAHAGMRSAMAAERVEKKSLEEEAERKMIHRKLPEPRRLSRVDEIGTGQRMIEAKRSVSGGAHSRSSRSSR